MPSKTRGREFLRHTIRHFILIAIGLGGTLYELLTSDPIRWLLIGGYGFIVAASVYRIWAFAQQDDETGEGE